MTDAAAKLRQFHSTTPVWAKEDRAVLLASADTIEAQAERIRVLREALHEIAWHRPPGRTYKIVETLESKALAALEATK